MLLLISLFIVLLVGVALCYFSRFQYHSIWEFVGSGIWIGAGFVLGISLILIPIFRIGIKTEIIKLESTRISINTARTNDPVEPIENAAIQFKIIEANKWLAATKYWNDSIFDLWIPDEVDSVCEIR